MSTTLHTGHHLTQTVAGSDGSTIPPGTLGVTIVPTSGVVTVAVTPANNNILVTATGVGTATLTYNALGYTSSQDIVTVLAPPSIVVTDGPEV